MRIVHATAGQPPIQLPEAWKQFRNALSRCAESDLNAILTLTRFPNRGSDAEYSFNTGLAEALLEVYRHLFLILPICLRVESTASISIQDIR